MDESQDCAYLEEEHGITHADFLAWNPSVKDDCSGIKVGYSYCTYKFPDPVDPRWTTGTSTPLPTQTGMVPYCDEYYLVGEGMTCTDLTGWMSHYGYFYLWNTGVNEQCSNLWVDTWYCIGIDYEKSSSLAATTISSPATATPTTPMSITATATTLSSKVSTPARPTATSSPISTDGRCGTNTPNNAICAGSGFGLCCSKSGWCGDSTDHCGVGNCHSGDCVVPAPGFVSTDGFCRPMNNATCPGSTFGDCCSNNGYCGNTLGHCGPGNCYSGACIISDVPVSTDGQCGPSTSNDTSCVNSGFGNCCSLSGWCGDSEDHCGKGKCYSGACL